MSAMRWFCLLLALPVSLVFADANPRSGFVQVPGGPVWYEIAGDGAGAPRLTLHGGPGGTSCGSQLLYPLISTPRWIRDADALRATLPQAAPDKFLIRRLPLRSCPAPGCA